MLYDPDTIAAIATAPGPGSVAIVRLSGSEAMQIADRIFRGEIRPSDLPDRSFAYGHIADGKTRLDEVLLLVMRGPRSYTREDVVEIQGHGGGQASQQILRLALDCGARTAEPGEFTKRAFLNGRIDLLQAEAVLDLIQAQSGRAAVAAIEQLEGKLSREFDLIYDQLLAIAADLEATLDFPEDELPAMVMDQILDALHSARNELEQLLTGWDEGHLLRDGALVVISGLPNVGKSTLMNLLLGKDRAIVSASPGTTRDSIEETLVVAGVPVRLVDTAGLRDVDCEIEREGIRRAKAHIEDADMHLFVVDGSKPLSQEELVRIASLDPAKSILILNKNDLGSASIGANVFAGNIMQLSALQNDAYTIMVSSMAKLLKESHHLSARPRAVISERHRQLLVVSKRELCEAETLLESRREDVVVLAAARLRGALEKLGEVTGRVYQDQLIESIFSRFCIGK